MKVVNKIGELELRYSAQVILKIDEKLEVKIDEILTLKFVINNDSKKGVGAYEIKFADNSTMLYTISNVSSNIVESVIEPNKIGAYQGKELFIGVYFKSINRNDEILYFFTYQVFLGKDVENV